jgi:hypothetical protein
MRKYVISVVIFVALTASICLQVGGAEPQRPAAEKKGANQLSVPKTKKSAVKEEALKDFLSNETTWLRYFITKHGDMKILDENRKYGERTQVILNDVPILKAQKTPDGRQQDFIIEISNIQNSQDYKGGQPEKIDRILLLEGCGIDYVTQFILLDFTCDKPFVSERFGFNPGLKWHIHLGQVKWGKEKSYIDLDPKEQGRYVYYTCDRIEDITDDEDAKESAQRKKKTQQKQKPANKTHR